MHSFLVSRCKAPSVSPRIEGLSTKSRHSYGDLHLDSSLSKASSARPSIHGQWQRDTRCLMLAFLCDCLARCGALKLMENQHRDKKLNVKSVKSFARIVYT
ncbi:hypothetical protein GOP47_0009901 [Adiantum capillus-veneris]|uniref:Uncharacterized protein n=1 Tax=Adiantum capillus-veneris TaxID=13818 RepID=A0A9D4UX55_ADICA|nr:hypothetical protein GOP47_0009901 [Adiantum capillus-veneris]